MKVPRLFIPLNTDAYNWFLGGQKKWELRNYGRQFTEKNVFVNKVVELRKGYSNAEESIWGVVSEVLIFKTFTQVYEFIDYKEVIPIASSKEEAIAISENILGNSDEKNSKLMLIGIKKIGEGIPDFLEIDGKYIEEIMSLRKKTTIRLGRREYNHKVCILFNNATAIIVIISGTQTKNYSQLNSTDAQLDGFASLNDLLVALKKHYPKISETDNVTIIEFNLMGGK